MENNREAIDLNTRKQVMLGLLRRFQQYCATHNLKFYLAGGTLLGAVRHGGFIPWDDDIDVMMPISDYNKLIHLVEEAPIESPYYFSTPSNNPDHMWPFLKLIDQRTVLIEQMIARRRKQKQERYYGIYIDIFPMYGLPQVASQRASFQNELNRLYKCFAKATRVMIRRPTDSNFIYYFRYILYFIYCLPYKIVGGKHYLKKINELVNKIPLRDTDYWGFAEGLTKGDADHELSSYLDNETDISFEDLRCKILSAYDEMLTRQYGDYMTPPPESKRHIHPAIVKWRNGGAEI